MAKDITFVTPKNLTELEQLTDTSVVLVDASGNALAKMPTETFAEIIKFDEIDAVPTSGSNKAVSSGGVKAALEEKQDALVGGQNIKNIDGVSLLGAGNIVIGVQEINVSATVSGTAPNYTFVLNNYADFYNAIVAAKTAGKIPVSRLVIGQGSSAITLIGLISNKTSTTFNTSFQDSGTVIYMCEFNSPSAATPYKIEYVEQQEKLTFDDTPTTGSSNPVKSSGVKAAVDAVRRSFYEAAGAVYNATTGYYELNGLTDITEEQMSEIYAIGIGWHPGMDSYGRFALQRIRTNILPTSKNNASGTGCGVSGNNNYVAVSALGMFDTCIQLEVACVSVSRNAYFGIFPKSAINMFNNCRVLRKIIGYIVMIKTDANQTTNMFKGCAELREVSIRRLTQNLSFADSPLLYYSSLKYLVDNASNTAAITVTVHKTVYECLTGLHSSESDAKVNQEAEETGTTASQLWTNYQTLRNEAAQLHNISFAEP